MPGSNALAEQFRAAGAETTCADWPGYAAMMVEPHEAVIAHATLRAMVQWLGAPLAAAAPVEALRPEPSLQEVFSEAPASVLEGVRETPLAFGAGQGLFGILAEPSAPSRF